MTTPTFARPTVAEPKRDRWGRPSILQPDGSEVGYTRISTLAKAIDDTTNLTKWKMRQVAYGIGQRSDLATVAKVLDPVRDKAKLNALCEDAMNAAESGKAANLGTALHAFLEWADTPGFDLETVPAEYRNHVTNYIVERNRAKLVAIGMERFVVNDELQAAGSFDRIYVHPVHGVCVGDIKTGASAKDYPHSTTMQIATYAHSSLYDPATGQRTAIPGVNLEVGILIHLDQATGECHAYELDIAAGWKAAQLAYEVHQWRKAKGLVREVSP